MPNQTRSFFEYQGNRGFNLESSLEAFSTDSGITIEINDVTAVGSYNADVTATVVMPRDVAIKFRDWLNEVLQ